MPEEHLAAIAARLGHYGFRLFLRGAILAPAGFLPSGEAPLRPLAPPPP